MELYFRSMVVNPGGYKDDKAFKKNDIDGKKSFVCEKKSLIYNTYIRITWYLYSF